MSSVIAALRLVLRDVASLGSAGNRALVGGIAAAVVAVAAHLLGVTLTVAEVSGWIVLVAGIAATLEKLPVVKAARAGK